MRDWDYREIIFLGQGFSGRILRSRTLSTNGCENPESSLALICICLVACYSYMKFLKLDCWRSIYDQGFIDSKDQRVSYKLTKELFTTLCFFIISSRFQRNLNHQSMGSYRTEKSTGEVLLIPAHSFQAQAFQREASM